MNEDSSFSNKDRASLPKGIFLLPSLITTFAFFAGFYALISVFSGNFYNAAWAILLAAFFDFWDGKVARMTGTCSAFGEQYDSLADLMSFGIAPAFLAYSWVLQPYGRIGWMAAFLYAICGALRLARFNAQITVTGGTTSKFIGLPIPAAAMVIASLVILTKDFLVLDAVHPIIIVATVYALGFLMVSNFKYHSAKKLEFGKRRPFGMLVLAVLLVYIVAVIPELMFFLIAVVYAFSGPAIWLWQRWGAKNRQSQLTRGTHPE